MRGLERARRDDGVKGGYKTEGGGSGRARQRAHLLRLTPNHSAMQPNTAYHYHLRTHAVIASIDIYCIVVFDEVCEKDRLRTQGNFGINCNVYKIDDILATQPPCESCHQSKTRVLRGIELLHCKHGLALRKK